MGSGIYKRGKELSAKDVKTYIMKSRGWSEKEYLNARKGLTKQLTTFNKIAGEKQKVNSTAVQLLYKQSKAMKRYGRDYTKTEKLSLIESLPKTSGSYRSERQLSSALSEYNSYVFNRFSGLIKANPGAKAIWEKYSNDPIKLNDKLTEYADKLHVAIDNQRKRVSKQSIPFGQIYGSDYVIDIPDLEEVNEDELPF